MTYEDYQRELDLQLGRLKKVDQIMADPVRSLIRIYRHWNDNRTKDKTVPSFITSEHRDKASAMLVHAMTCSTLQRLALGRHRYSWMSKEDDKFLASLHDDVANIFLPSFDRAKPLDMVTAFDDQMFGALNPLAAAEIFRVLINSGERNAHRGAGFLMFFSMFWSLHRRVPRSFFGARLDPWLPTASVTARCLVVIDDLMNIINRRSSRYGEMLEALEAIAKNAGHGSQFKRWGAVSGLQRLAAAMHALSDVAINGPKFLDEAHAVAKLVEDVGPGTPTLLLWNTVAARVRGVLLDLEKTNVEVLADASAINDGVLKEIVAMLGTPEGRGKLTGLCHQLVDGPLHPDKRDEYWADLEAAARSAQKNAQTVLDALKSGIEVCEPLHEADSAGIDVFRKVLKGLQKTNDDVSLQLRKTVQENVEWMPGVISQHVAFASADNLTHFDPAELLSAIAVAERWSLDFTDTEAANAIKKAIDAGQRPDGSFVTTQPIYLVKRVHGVWPPNADVGWLLAAAAYEKKEVTVADEGIFRFVDWLERNRIDKPGTPKRSGWSSDTREQDVIDTWATCSGINALMEIRNLVEHRLWQLCEKRFLVRRKGDLKRLTEIDPVDLGLIHHHRLHYRLATMARETARRDDSGPDPEYAFVLHGPPGSSKTAIAEALGREMWGGQNPRFVRITPADFTRGGEAGLDREARFVFDLLSHVRKVTVFFDEIDDLLRLRSGQSDVNFLKLIVPAMLNRLQDLRDVAHRQEVCFLLATNFIDNIEPALTRPGRIDAVIPVPYPDAWSREAILEKTFVPRRVPPEVETVVVTESMGWPWSTYQKLCKRLARMTEVTPEKAIAEMKRLAAEFESSDSYYFDPQRWTRASRPLMNEFIRVAFSLSKDKQTCRRKLLALITDLKAEKVDLKRLPFETTFDSEWERTH
jgi:ATPase family associated with various cellular activities (AAA)